MPEPSAQLLIINRVRSRFQANIALKKKKEEEEGSSHPRAAICHVLLMCQAVGGERDCRAWGREKVPLGPALPEGWLTSSLPFVTADRALQRERGAPVGFDPSGPASEQKESTIPSRCRW